MIKKDWEKIFDSIKYLKRFLNNFAYIYDVTKNGQEVFGKILSSSGYIDEIFIDKSTCMNIDSDFYYFCLDVKKILDTTPFSRAEGKYLTLWLNGYTEKDIGEYYGVLREGVHCRLITCCKKIISEWENNYAE